MLSDVAASILAACALLVLYTYVLYPLALSALGRISGAPEPETAAPDEWPTVSLTLPAYNEAHQIADTVESLLAVDYPRDRLQILVVSDGSTDGTDRIVESYADRGVELLRVEQRGGKGAAENAALPHLEGEIVVNTDASVRIEPDAVKRLVRALQDPRVGLASGRDVSTGAGEADANAGESGYVGYEMWVRDLETRVSSIVGASGCLYAIRRELHRVPLPDHLSRDFAAAMNVRERGYRAVSVPDAVCRVPRTASLTEEYRRKVRTMTRGLETLWYGKRFLNPFAYGRFAWMLFSHKVCRWLAPWAGVAGAAALVPLAAGQGWAAALLGLGAGGAAAGAAAWALSERFEVSSALSVPAYALMGNVAALRAGIRFLLGKKNARWEPTRRSSAPSA